MLSTNLIQAKQEIHLMIDFIERLKTEIRFQARELKEIFEVLACEDRFSKLTFIPLCLKEMENTSFPAAWEKAVKETQMKLNKENATLLLSMSDILGASDAQGQLNMLDMVEQSFKRSLEEAEKNAVVKGRMYRSLGILCGLGLGVLFI